MKVEIGQSIRINEWTTIDIAGNPNIIQDLNNGIPLADNSVDELKAYNILEHLDDVMFAMDEIWRVCKNEAKVHISVPGNYYAFALDPQHKHAFVARTFDFFTNRLAERRRQYGIKSNYQIISIVEEIYPNDTNEMHLIVEMVVRK